MEPFSTVRLANGNLRPKRVVVTRHSNGQALDIFASFDNWYLNEYSHPFEYVRLIINVGNINSRHSSYWYKKHGPGKVLAQRDKLGQVLCTLKWTLSMDTDAELKDLSSNFLAGNAFYFVSATEDPDGKDLSKLTDLYVVNRCLGGGDSFGGYDNYSNDHHLDFPFSNYGVPTSGYALWFEPSGQVLVRRIYTELDRADVENDTASTSSSSSAPGYKWSDTGDLTQYYVEHGKTTSS